MKILLILLILSAPTFASVEEFPVMSRDRKLPRKTFDRIIRIFEETFSPLANNQGRELVFMTDYDADWAQAFARRWETDQVIVYGGIAALRNGSEDSFALILCHETGHLYGGRPVSDEYNHLSLEGQADYWATSVCLPKIIPRLSPLDISHEDRIVNAALTVTAHFADNRNLPHPRIETPDLSVATSTNLTHPLPQCRLDTMLAGLQGLPRPLCWFRP